MAKVKTAFFCTECGYESAKWVGKCPSCQNWNTFVEELKQQAPSNNHHSISTQTRAEKIRFIEESDVTKTATDYQEFNRVLGGGVVPGSLILIGGDPGIGKSTLLLQVANNIGLKNTVLYVSGEESARQIKLRASRLGTLAEELYLYAENDMSLIEQQIDQLQPECVIIDSIQTIYSQSITSAPGTVSQVRDCTAQLMRIAKSKRVTIFIVGHVTKDGMIAGPKMLEHMVDTVLYFEGERHNTYRILRAVKNRFGATNELAIFDMQASGLVEVTNPSELFLSEHETANSGVAIVATLEGTRPLLIEVQALLSPTAFGNPRRMTSGIDTNKVALILAVLEKKNGLLLQLQDVFMKVTGGVKIDEPAIDLAVAMAITSSFKDKPLPFDTVIIGEIGLTGEIRQVTKVEDRIKEAEKLGFTRIVIPNGNFSKLQIKTKIEIVPVKTVQDAIRILF